MDIFLVNLDINRIAGDTVLIWFKTWKWLSFLKSKEHFFSKNARLQVRKPQYKVFSSNEYDVREIQESVVSVPDFFFFLVFFKKGRTFGSISPSLTRHYFLKKTQNFWKEFQCLDKILTKWSESYAIRQNSIFFIINRLNLEMIIYCTLL